MLPDDLTLISNLAMLYDAVFAVNSICIFGERRPDMKKASPDRRIGDRLRRDWPALLVLLLAALLFLGVRLSLREERTEAAAPGDYVEYERGVVTAILSDSCFSDPVSEGALRGVQDLIVTAETGQYAGTTFMAKNYVYPMYGGAVKEGDSVSLILSTYSNGQVFAEVFQYNRITPLLIVIGIFFAVTLLVGRGTGARSLVALVITVLCLFTILFPLLMRGAPTLLTVFLVCAYITAVSFTILGGVRRKSLCAMLGTLAGVAIALLFGLLAQALCRVNGLNTGSEPIGYLTQLRNDGVPVRMKGLLAAGVTVSALGAVMDVAMSISSALEEVHGANPALGFRALFRSGMNIGKDMVGTMTNTLILAFLGSSFTTILYLYALGLSPYQLLPSAYLSVEVVSGVSSSIGMILAIPLTAAVSALWLDRRKRA